MLSKGMFEIITVIAIPLAGWLFKIVWGEVNKLRETQSILNNQIHEIKNLVAGDYVRREDLEGKIDNIFKKLEKIDDKVNAHVDRLEKRIRETGASQ